MTARSDRPQSVMGRALLLLEPFREARNLTLTDLAERAGLPRSSTHRMLLQLVEVGWLRREGTSYCLGPKMVELGSIARDHDRIHRATAALLHQLHRRTASAVHLSVLDAGELLYLEKVGGRWAATLPTRPGQRRPAEGTAEGEALLACLADRAPTLREATTTQDGRSLHHLAVAFDAGACEVAAISLCGPSGCLPTTAHNLLHGAVDLASRLLAEDLRGS